MCIIGYVLDFAHRHQELRDPLVGQKKVEQKRQKLFLNDYFISY